MCFSLPSCASQEKRIAETVVDEMNDQQKSEYYKLKDLNDHLLKQLAIGQNELLQMSTRRSEMEADIATSKVIHVIGCSF